MIGASRAFPLQIEVSGGGLLAVLIVALSVTYVRSVTEVGGDGDETVVSITVSDDVVGWPYRDADYVSVRPSEVDGEADADGDGAEAARVALTDAEAEVELDPGRWTLEAVGDRQTIGTESVGVSHELSTQCASMAVDPDTVDVTVTGGPERLPLDGVTVAPVGGSAEAHTDEDMITTNDEGRRRIDGLPVGEYGVSTRPAVDGVETTAAASSVTVSDGEVTNVTLPIEVQCSLTGSRRDRAATLADRIDELSADSARDVAIPHYYGTVLAAVLEVVEAVAATPPRAVVAGVHPNAGVDALLDATERGIDAVADAMSERRVVRLFGTCASMPPATVGWDGAESVTLAGFLDCAAGGADHERHAFRERLAETDDFLDRRWGESRRERPGSDAPRPIRRVHVGARRRRPGTRGRRPGVRRRPSARRDRGTVRSRPATPASRRANPLRRPPDRDRSRSGSLSRRSTDDHAESDDAEEEPYGAGRGRPVERRLRDATEDVDRPAPDVEVALGTHPRRARHAPCRPPLVGRVSYHDHAAGRRRSDPVLRDRHASGFRERPRDRAALGRQRLRSRPVGGRQVPVRGFEVGVPRDDADEPARDHEREEQPTRSDEVTPVHVCRWYFTTVRVTVPIGSGMSRGWRSDGQEMADLVVEFRQSGAVPEAVVAEAERLYAAGKYHEALLCVLEARE